MKGRKGSARKLGTGNTNPPVGNYYAGGGSNVAKEVQERKRGGRVSGMMGKKRLDRPGRKRGGRVGADTSPLSSANKMSFAGPGKQNCKGCTF